MNLYCSRKIYNTQHKTSLIFLQIIVEVNRLMLVKTSKRIHYKMHLSKTKVHQIVVGNNNHTVIIHNTFLII